MRVALATNFVSPYRIPLYAALTEIPGWSFKVFCSSEKDFNREWDIKQKFPFDCKNNFNISYERRHKRDKQVKFNESKEVHLPLGLFMDLCRFKPDAIISSEMGARSFIAAIYALLARKRLIIWYYVTIHSEKNTSWRQRLLRKFLSRRANAFIGMGREARRYLEGLGIQQEMIFDAKNAIQMAPFLRPITSDQRRVIRQSLGLSGLVYLFVGRLSSLKGVDLLLDAWDDFCTQVENKASLLLVGEDLQKGNLQNRVQKMRFNNVKFLSFVQPERIPNIYLSADVFVFPTLVDVWGLVVNEAMASGLPVICSKYAGCASDLLIDGMNGWMVDPLNRIDLVQKLTLAWEKRDQLETIGKTSQRLIEKINISAMAKGFQDAVNHATSY